jgi:perosamine synthetase
MHFFHTNISRDAIDRVVKVLESTYVSQGEQVALFERKLSQDLGLSHPVAVNSGTAALHLALVGAGVQAGDEVVLPAQTFIATGLAVLYVGAVPVFADVQATTGNIDPASIRQHLNEKTKAVIPVHWGGLPCDMDEIQAIADAHGLTVIEDAAHALGARYRGRPIGAVSEFTCFSFQAIKHLTSGDGGAVCCRSPQMRQTLAALRWFGIDRERDKPDFRGERVYDLGVVGYKYHMNDLAAALALGNLPQLPGVLARHREITARYSEGLRDIPGLRPADCPDDRESSCWFFQLLVERRDDFIRAMQGRGMPVSVVHERIDRNRIFGGLRTDLPGQDAFSRQQAALPVHAGLTDAAVQGIVAAVHQGW